MTNAERWALAMKAKPMIERLLLKWRRYIDAERFDDLTHTVLIELHRRAPEFDPSLATWNTFAGWIIRGKLSREARFGNLLYGPVNVRSRPMWREDPAVLDRRTQPSHEHASNLRIDVDRLIFEMHVVLKDKRERDALLRQACGETLTEIGQTYHVSRERIRQLQVRGVKRLRKVLRVRAENESCQP